MTSTLHDISARPAATLTPDPTGRRQRMLQMGVSTDPDLGHAGVVLQRCSCKARQRSYKASTTQVLHPCCQDRTRHNAKTTDWSAKRDIRLDNNWPCFSLGFCNLVLLSRSLAVFDCSLITNIASKAISWQTDNGQIHWASLYVIVNHARLAVVRLPGAGPGRRVSSRCW